MKLADYGRSFARPIGKAVTAYFLRSTFSPDLRTRSSHSMPFPSSSSRSSADKARARSLAPGQVVAGRAKAAVRVPA